MIRKIIEFVGKFFYYMFLCLISPIIVIWIIGRVIHDIIVTEMDEFCH